MNVDQIVDKRTVAIPGPKGDRGPQGPQGLPGVDAVPADEAVAAYIGDAASKTHAALGVKADAADVYPRTGTYSKSEVDDRIPARAGVVTGDGSYKGMIRVAHRCGTGWPEQSVRGALWCVRNGLIPEFDVHQLADGTPVLCHDDTTGRTMTGPDKPVASIADLAEWRTRRLKPAITGGYTETAPTLETMLQTAGATGVLACECKALTQSTMTAICDMLERYHLQGRAIVTCFDRDLCRYAAGRGFNVMWNLNAQTMTGVDWTTVKDDGITWVAPQLSDTTTDAMHAMHAAGLKVDLWLIDTFSALSQAVSLGADGITGNRIDYVSGTMEHTGTPFHDGRALFGQPTLKDDPSRKYPLAANGPTMEGDKICYVGYADNDDYVEILPYEETGILLDDANALGYNITIEGITGNSTGPSDTTHIFTVGIVHADDPDAPWIDNNDYTRQSIATTFMRRNGRMGATFAHAGTMDVKTEIDTKIAMGLTAIKYTASITFHNASMTIRFSNGTSATQQSFATTTAVLPTGTPFRLFMTFCNRDQGTVLQVTTRRESDGVAERNL